MEAKKLNDFSSRKITEREIIKGVLSGNKELFEILVRRNNQKMYRMIRSYIKDEAEIEDIMQNTYISAYTKLHQFKLQSSFSTWLMRIAINESLARLKEKEKLYQLNDQSYIFNRTIFQISDTKQSNPQEKMIRNEARQLLENAIDQLETKYKIVYMMREVEEMSLKEISNTLDLTVANVKIRLHRSKEMLKKTLFEISKDKNIFEFGFSRCDRITELVMKQI